MNYEQLDRLTRNRLYGSVDPIEVLEDERGFHLPLPEDCLARIVEDNLVIMLGVRYSTAGTFRVEEATTEVFRIGLGEIAVYHAIPTHRYIRAAAMWPGGLTCNYNRNDDTKDMPLSTAEVRAEAGMKINDIKPAPYFANETATARLTARAFEQIETELRYRRNYFREHNAANIWHVWRRAPLFFPGVGYSSGTVKPDTFNVVGTCELAMVGTR